MNASITMAFPVVLLCGCAASYTEPTLPEDHPGNPHASAAPMPVLSSTLDAGSANPLAPEDPPASGDYAALGQPSAAAPANQAEGPASQGIVVYACPMHPEVTSTDPEARCHRCGMRLTVKSEGGAR